MAEPCRLRCEAGLKLRLAVLLVIAIGAAYFLTGHFPSGEAVQLRPGLVETAIGFHPGWIWVYLSLYLLMPIGPLLLERRRQLLRYAGGMLAITCVACLVFVVVPTATDRGASAPEAPLPYRLVVALDPPTNAVPSLHCAFAAYSAGIVSFVAARAWRPGVWLWFALICFSTLATRQHMLLDVVSGTVLGGGAYLLVWRAEVSPGLAPDLRCSP